MSYYAERNGLAKFWERNSISVTVSNYTRYHPQKIEQLINKLLESDTECCIPISNTEIDNITGVKLNGST